MDYVQITPSQQRHMLDAIGVKSVDELFASLPATARLNRALKIPPAMSELELQRRIGQLTAANRPADQSACFLGCGAYDHFIPSFIDQIIVNGKFLTAYTPYQAEASQGSLQAFFEFQTQVARLSGMDIANASLYEGASAAAEAVYLALNTTGKRRVVISAAVHPHYRQVIATNCSDLPVEIVTVPVDAKSGRTDVAAFSEAVHHDTACVVVQSPNVYGVLEEWSKLFETAHAQNKTLAIAVFNPIACGLLKRPGDCGADIAVADGQPLGIPLSFGGPWLGLFAARQDLMRRMPGRLIGQTTDSTGRRGFCLTLQTREQHIRGAKATSNVCTNQGLLALRATMYMTTLGPTGLRRVAEQCFYKAHYAASQIEALDGYSLAYGGSFFHEFVVNCPRSAAELRRDAESHGLMPGVDLSTLDIGAPHQLLVAVTEKRSREEIDALVRFLKEAA